MASSFTWLDYSEEDKRKMTGVIDQFRERDTRDELGIGSVRDGFADLLFPGTNTIQTRAKYFLFVPWIYLELENKKIPSNQFSLKARQIEIDLIKALMNSEDKEGIFGKYAGKNLKRLPSSVYWQGLGQLGIRRFKGNQSQYFQLVDRFYIKHNRNRARVEEGELPGDGERVERNWHGSLPPVPNDFPKNASLALTANEAEYLKECLIQSAHGSLLAFLVNINTSEIRKFLKDTKSVSFPWEHSRYNSFSEEIKKQLEHARYFSEIIWGVSLMYNLMLAEKANSINENQTDRVKDYGVRLQNWWEIVLKRKSSFIEWANPRQPFWEVVRSSHSRVTPATRRFIDSWIDITIKWLDKENLEKLVKDPDVQHLISERERSLKRGQARLHNPRALELWGGAAGIGRLDYRWGNTAQVIVGDILKGLANN